MYGTIIYNLLKIQSLSPLATIDWPIGLCCEDCLRWEFHHKLYMMELWDGNSILKPLFLLLLYVYFCSCLLQKQDREK